MAFRVDNLQYSNWSRPIFQQMRDGGLDVVHATIAYHENFREMVFNIEKWNILFDDHSDLIMRAGTFADFGKAKKSGRTAIVFGTQTPAPIEDDVGLVAILHTLGVRFMQLTYNNQSLLATGCYEKIDSGITRMGRQVISEMNRVGIAIDMSHSSDRSTLEAIELSTRPIAITHANPSFWMPARRNKSIEILKSLAAHGGMFGFSLYPHHLKNGSCCTLDEFCTMIARTAELIGEEYLGIGSDLCQNQPDTVVKWMRNGRWTKDIDYGEGSKDNAGFPNQPTWFKDNRDFANLEIGLNKVGFSKRGVDRILGENWMRFYHQSFSSSAKQENGLVGGGR